ncbi:MAG TPA: PorP/SprF family type IX secretion system membrane protein [Bacteroidales bacterium]|nr:PorP/SprF family type IX secretion system membrane protein [Bacteroidales bacterium]
MRILSVILFCLALAGLLNAQEKAILYGHYSFNGLAINPAYTGSHDMLSIGLSHRSQWVGFEGAPSFNVAAIHAPYKNTHMALGLLVMNESIGLRNFTGIYFNYAYRMQVGAGKLSLGLKGGIGTGKIQGLDLGDDLVFSQNANSYLLPNFGVGAYYYTRNFYAGLSVPLLMHYKSEGNGEVTAYHSFSNYIYYLTTGLKISLAQDWQVHPSALVMYDKADKAVVNGGMGLLYKDVFEIGASYRSSKAVIALVDIKLNYQIKLGVAYEYGMSEINNYNRNSFEVALEYNFGYRIKSSNPTVF